MQDGIIKGVGNSRFLKSVPAFLTLYPTYEAFAEALIAGTLPVYLNGINEAGWTQLGTALNKANLLSDATEKNFGLDVTKVDKPLSEYPESAVVWLSEGGTMTPFYVIQHNYQSALNGSGRTLLMRVNDIGKMAWNESGVNTYADSTIDTLLNTEYKAKLPADVQTAMGTTTFEYTPGNGNNTMTTLARAVFLVSNTEAGWDNPSWANVEGEPVLEKTDILMDTWTRTPLTANYPTTRAVCLYNRARNSVDVNQSYPFSPVFTLPQTFTPDAYYLDEFTGFATTEDSVSVTPDGALERLWGIEVFTVTGSDLAFSPKTLPIGRYVLRETSGLNPTKNRTFKLTKFGNGTIYTNVNGTSSSSAGAAELTTPPVNGALFELLTYHVSNRMFEIRNYARTSLTSPYISFGGMEVNDADILMTCTRYAETDLFTLYRLPD